MKKIFVFIMLSLFLLGIYNNVFADYKIILKNGGKFIANDYKKEGNSIKLYTPNGEIEIDQINIESIKSVDIEEDTNEPAAKPEANKKVSDKHIEDLLTPPVEVKTPEGKISDTAKKEIELKSEKNKLHEESKKLKEDFKKEGRLMSIRKKREFEQRSQELNKKIKEYNDEIEKLKKGNK